MSTSFEPIRLSNSAYLLAAFQAHTETVSRIEPVRGNIYTGLSGGGSVSRQMTKFDLVVKVINQYQARRQFHLEITRYGTTDRDMVTDRTTLKSVMLAPGESELMTVGSAKGCKLVSLTKWAISSEKDEVIEAERLAVPLFDHAYQQLDTIERFMVRYKIGGPVAANGQRSGSTKWLFILAIGFPATMLILGIIGRLLN